MSETVREGLSGLWEAAHQNRVTVEKKQETHGIFFEGAERNHF